MLNRAKVLSELQKISTQLFLDFSSEREIAYAIWQQISCDSLFAQKIAQAQSPWIMPSWLGNLSDVFDCILHDRMYGIVGVDGSQIYPDRHQGTPCFLINIGSVHIVYDSVPLVAFDSQPYVFMPELHEDIIESPEDMVNCRRQDLELKHGMQLSAISRVQHSNIPYVLLYDGSLIFWHLEQQMHDIKMHYMGSYLQHLSASPQEQTVMAGYISLPKSKEIINLIRFALGEGDPQNSDAHKAVEHVVDAQLMSCFLQPFQRSTIFKSNVGITEWYPELLKPHFFYMHNGSEIVRVEIPQWLAYDEQKIDMLAAVIIDQSNKGRGYPVVLAEAHEQAVVKGPDREFFYHVIARYGFQQQRTLAISHKSVKKRGIGI